MRISDWSSDVCSSDLSDAEHRAKMKKIQAAQAKKVAAKTVEKGLVIVHTGPGKGKTSAALGMAVRSEEHTSELQSLMRISYAVFCLKKKKTATTCTNNRRRTGEHADNTTTTNISENQPKSS